MDHSVKPPKTSHGLLPWKLLVTAALVTGAVLFQVTGGNRQESDPPPETSPTVRLLLRRCLSKDRKRRLQAIGDAISSIREFIS